MKKVGPVVFRADASSESGSGHVMRCLALAQELKVRGREVILVAASLPPFLQERMQREGLDVRLFDIRIGDIQDANETIRICAESSSSWLVLDGYHFDREYQKAVAAASQNLMIMDDYVHMETYEADLLLNQNLGVSEADYEEKFKGGALLLGPTYCLLRQEFLSGGRRKPSVHSTVEHIVVSFGGSDPALKTSDALQTLERLRNVGEWEATVVVGPAFSSRGCIPPAHPEEPSNHRIHLRRNVESMGDLLATADLAVVAAGSICWELLFMGVPFLTVVVAENQCRNAEVLEERGATVLLGWAEDVGIDQMEQGIRTLIDDAPRRHALADAGKDLVDGRGRSRVVDAMEAVEQSEEVWSG